MDGKIVGTSPRPASSLPRPAAICCMCGDRGLASELFRCRVCFFRSQHKYCSNLYPKPHSYKTCNWCLREEIRSKNSLSLEEEKTITGKNISALILTPIAQRSSGCGNLTSGDGRLKLTPRLFSPLLSKAVKKQRLIPGGNSKARPVIRIRGKVKRYKLLEEVIC